MSDVVQRLLELVLVESELACECDCPPEATANYQYAKTCEEAADTITALRAEVERLKVENEAVLSANRDVMLHWDVLKADYEKLRAALRGIAYFYEGTPRSAPPWDAAQTARAALEEKQ